MVTRLGEVFDDNVVCGGNQRQRAVALLAVDIELVVLHLSHFQRALGIAAVGEGELEQVECRGSFVSGSEGTLVFLALACLGQVDESAEQVIRLVALAVEADGVDHHRSLQDKGTAVAEMRHGACGGLHGLQGA